MVPCQKKNMETNPISILLIPINSNKPLKRHWDIINKRGIQKWDIVTESTKEEFQNIQRKVPQK